MVMVYDVQEKRDVSLPTGTMHNKGDSRPRHLQGKRCKHWSG